MSTDLNPHTCKRCGRWSGPYAVLPGQSREHLCMCAPSFMTMPDPARFYVSPLARFPDLATRAELEDRIEQQAAEIARLRAALLDANGICRSAFQIANRIATEYSTNEMGTYFGAFSERADESLKRQHAAILATGGYPVLDGAAREST